MRFGNIVKSAAFGMMLAAGWADIGGAVAVSSQAEFPPAPSADGGRLRHKAVHHRVIRRKPAHRRAAEEHKAVHRRAEAHKTARRETARHERYRGQAAARHRRGRRIGSSYERQMSLTGQWQAVSMNGRPVMTGMQDGLPSLAFSGRVANGQSGCNNFSSSVIESGTQVQFVTSPVTRFACPKPLAKQEREFYKALGETQSYRFASRLYDEFPGRKISGGVYTVRELQFLDKTGRPVLVLVRK